MKVPFSAPEFGEEEIEEVNAVIKTGWLTTASRCERFEKKFADFLGTKYALAVNSGTAALHLGLEALGICQGDKVLVPTYTFTATAEVIRYLGADPVFVDCDKDTFCMDLIHLEKTLSAMTHEQRDRLKAVIPVHFGGHPCEMDGIQEFAARLGLKILEDAAHALPTRYRSMRAKVGGRNSGANKLRMNNIKSQKMMVGTIGDATCFSFYANKTITTGEGGMLSTDNDMIAKRIKTMRLHGINRDAWDRFSTGASWEYDIIAPGFKYNMPDIAAALGIHQLRKADLFRERRQRIAEAYYDGLKQIRGLILPRLHCDMEDHSWYLYMVLIEMDETGNGIDRNRFIEEMTKQEIGTSVHYKPLHRMTYYKRKYAFRPEMFPNAEWVFKRCVCLPIFSAMTDGQVDYVIRSVRKILGQ
jgi:dTDP-4-amino-4,6-dideoxygalactose transaminase